MEQLSLATDPKPPDDVIHDAGPEDDMVGIPQAKQLYAHFQGLVRQQSYEGEENLLQTAASATDDDIDEALQSQMDEVSALRAIFGAAVRVLPPSDQCQEPRVKVAVRPYPGNSRPNFVWMELVFTLVTGYPSSSPPSVQIGRSQALTVGDIICAVNMLDLEADKRQGDPMMYDLCLVAQAFLEEYQAYMFEKMPHMDLEEVLMDDVDKDEEERLELQRLPPAQRKLAATKKRAKMKAVISSRARTAVVDGSENLPKWLLEHKDIPTIPHLIADLTQMDRAFSNFNVIASPFIIERFRISLAKDYGPIIITYHGTAANNVSSIGQYGLVAGGDRAGNKKINVKNGTVYGRGVYCTPKLSYAMQYGSSILVLAVILKQQDTQVGETIIVVKEAHRVLPIYSFKVANVVR